MAALVIVIIPDCSHFFPFSPFLFLGSDTTVQFGQEQKQKPTPCFRAGVLRSMESKGSGGCIS